MIGCGLTGGLQITCDNFAPGLQQFYAANYNAVVYSSITFNASNVVTGLTMTGGSFFYIYDLPKQTGELVQNINANPSNGTYAVEQVMTVQLNNLSTYVRNKVKTLTQAKLLTICRDMQNTYWLCGYVNGVYAEGTNTSTSGKNFLTDPSSFMLNFVAQEPDLCFEVSSSLIPNIISY